MVILFINVTACLIVRPYNPPYEGIGATMIVNICVHTKVNTLVKFYDRFAMIFIIYVLPLANRSSYFMLIFECKIIDCRLSL